MPRGYRIAIFAAVGWLSLTAEQPNPSAQSKQAQTDRRVGDALTNIAATYDNQAKRAQSPKESRPCEPGEDQRDSDLCAQWKAADAAENAAWWAAATGWISALGLVGVAAALGLNIWSNVMTRAALRLTRRSSQADLQPYVHATMAKIDTCETNPPQVSVTFENVGRTPALRAEFFVNLDAAEWFEATSYQPALLNNSVNVGSIPPNQKRSRILQLSMFKAAIAKMSDLMIDGVYKPQFVLRGFVRYFDIFGARYITEFAYITDELPEVASTKLRPVHMVGPTYQQVDDQDRPTNHD
jgi:hypothetical protein